MEQQFFHQNSKRVRQVEYVNFIQGYNLVLIIFLYNALQEHSTWFIQLSN